MRALSLTVHCFICLLALSFQGFSQLKTMSPNLSQHSVNAHYAFSHAADVALDDDRKQQFPGLGYQFTTRKNWYVGADIQYARNRLPNYALDPLSADGFYTYLSNQIPGGVGYFTRLDYTPPTYIILTSDSIFRTPADQYPVLSNLYSERLNLFVHFGKRWVKNKNQIEFGFTLQGTFFNSSEAITDFKFLPIITYDSTTGFGFQYDDGARYAQRLERSRFALGAGLHVRYTYQLSQRIGAGLQVMANGSAEGLFVQVSPRMVYNIKNQ